MSKMYKNRFDDKKKCEIKFLNQIDSFMVQCITNVVGTNSKNHITSYIEYICTIYKSNFNFKMYIICKKYEKEIKKPSTNLI